MTHELQHVELNTNQNYWIEKHFFLSFGRTKNAVFMLHNFCWKKYFSSFDFDARDFFFLSLTSTCSNNCSKRKKEVFLRSIPVCLWLIVINRSVLLTEIKTNWAKNSKGWKLQQQQKLIGLTFQFVSCISLRHIPQHNHDQIWCHDECYMSNMWEAFNSQCLMLKVSGFVSIN